MSLPAPLSSCRAAWRILAALACGLAAFVPHVAGQTDGAFRWPGPFRFGARTNLESSPAVGPDGVIYIGVTEQTTPARGRVIAINENGAEKWQSEQLPEAVFSSPAISADGSTLYVGCYDGKLYALSTADGAKRWEYSTGLINYIVSSPAVGADGTVYVGAGDLFLPAGGDSGLYAIRPDGTLRWRKLTADAGESSPAIGSDGTIYFGAKDFRLYAVRPDGSEQWRFQTDNEIWSSPAIASDGTLYIGTVGGRMYAVTRDGTRKWEYASGGSIFGGAALGADGTVYFGSQDWNLYALNGADGSVIWIRQLGAPVFSVPAVRSDGTIVAGADDRRLRALNPVNGQDVWSVQLSHAVQSSPVVDRNSIYVATLDGLLYALHSTTGLSAFSNWPMFRADPRHRGRAPPRADGGRLINLATRAAVGAGHSLIAGFVVRGTTIKHYLVRGVGPGLAQFGVPNPLADPTIALRFQSSGQLVPNGINDDWTDEAPGPPTSRTSQELGAFPLSPGSKDAAIVAFLAPDAYTATVAGNGGAGVVLVEAYDAVPTTPGARLVNLSTRGHVTPGNPIIAGLVIRGEGPLRLLVRGVGPGLTQFGVANVLARPSLAVFSGQKIIRTNTGWTTEGFKGDLAGAARVVGAFPLADNSADTAAVLTLDPGEYTIQIAGMGDTSGEVLVEVYAAP